MRRDGIELGNIEPASAKSQVPTAATAKRSRAGLGHWAGAPCQQPGLRSPVGRDPSMVTGDNYK